MRSKPVKRSRRRVRFGAIALAAAAVIGALAPISVQTLAQSSPWAGTYRNLNFGKFEHECPTWRYELAAQPDGQVEFRLIEPRAYRRWWEGKDADRSYHFLLGTPPCQYRMTFELNR